MLFVPGGGRVSRDGLRPGDGVTTYDEPVAVTAAWAQAVAMESFVSALKPATMETQTTVTPAATAAQ